VDYNISQLSQVKFSKRESVSPMTKDIKNILANLAYAYSQLGDLMKSKQAFDHALLAAEDTGIYISIILSVFNQFVNFYSIFNHHSC
jgi:hypothetical protein